MNNDKELFYLIANPLKINKEKLKKEKYIDKSLFNILLNYYFPAHTHFCMWLINFIINNFTI